MTFVKPYVNPIVKVCYILFIMLLLVSTVKGEEEKRVYRFGIDFNYKPYEYIDEYGDPAGFNLDLIEAIAEEMDFEYEIYAGSWWQVREMLEKHELDALLGMFYSEERSQNVDFSIPYVISYHAIYKRKDTPDIKSVEQLAGKEIIVGKGEYMHDFALRGELADCLVVSFDMEAALRLLATGKHDYALVTTLAANYWIRELEIKNVEKTGTPIGVSEYCFAVDKGDLELLSLLNEGLIALDSRGDLKTIKKRWIEPLDEYSWTFERFWKSARYVLALFLLVLFIAFLWTYTLKRQVLKKTKELESALSERMKARDALRESENRFFVFMDYLPAIAILREENAGIVYLNQFAQKIYSVDPDTPKIAEKRLKELEKDLFAEKDVIFESKIKSKNNREIYVECQRFSYTTKNNDRMQGIIGIDLTSRRQAEERLRNSREKLNFALEGAELAAFEWHLDTKNIYVDERWFRIFQMEETIPEEIEEMWEKIIHPDDIVRVRGGLDKQIGAKAQYMEDEYRVRTKDGKTKWILARGKVTKMSSDGIPLIMSGTVQDITAHRILEEQLQRAQKLEAVGRLASGVAHDFNNLLTAISGNAEILLLSLPGNHIMRREVEEILSTTDRAASLTRQLLAFSKKQEIARKTMDINKSVLSMMQMFKRIIGEDVTIKTTLDRDLWYVKMNSTQLESMLVNIMVNARDAMPDGGRINVVTKNIHLESGNDIVPMLNGDYVRISIADDGEGMSADVREKIFEPFFSTKPEGKGTGLGLATVYHIVHQMGGEILVESELDKGTTFQIYIPRSLDVAENAFVGMEKYSKLRGDESILVIEDDKSVRSTVVKTLQNFGYTLLEASGPEEAIRVLESPERLVDLFVVDVIMPGKIGPELMKVIEEKRTDVNVLYISGFNRDSLMERGRLPKDVEFLQKPFKPVELLSRVRTLIDDKKSV